MQNGILNNIRGSSGHIREYPMDEFTQARMNSNPHLSQLSGGLYEMNYEDNRKDKEAYKAMLR